MRTLTAAVLAAGFLMTGFLMTGFSMPGLAADLRAEAGPAPTVAQFSYALMPLPPLPAARQNHCGFVGGHAVCADHCGVDYQVYSCPATPSGCCHVGYGYCDGGGRLRCMAPWYDFSGLIP